MCCCPSISLGLMSDQVIPWLVCFSAWCWFRFTVVLESVAWPTFDKAYLSHRWPNKFTVDSVTARWPGHVTAKQAHIFTPPAPCLAVGMRGLYFFSLTAVLPGSCTMLSTVWYLAHMFFCFLLSALHRSDLWIRIGICLRCFLMVKCYSANCLVSKLMCSNNCFSKTLAYALFRTFRGTHLKAAEQQTASIELCTPADDQ